MTSTIENFPKDVISEILSRMSIKSLMRFRCVCKCWYALVRNYHFISKHFKNYNENNTRLFIDYEVVTDVDRRRELCVFLDETLTDLTYQEVEMPKLGLIMGPYDGIFCLAEYDRITLWNLATREFKTLPKCKIVPPRDTKLNYINIGFGIDLITNDCKLVLIRSLFHKKRYCFYEFSHVVIYTLSSSSWRNFKGNGLIRYQINGQSDGIYSNGVCYWLASQDYSQQIILSFDMDDEVFQEIQGPNSPPASTISALGSYNDTLLLIVFDTENEYFDMWVMREKIWIKKLTTIGPILGALWPLGFWKNDKFFIESRNGHLLLYDPSTQELKDLGCFCTATPGIFVHRYKESLMKIIAEDSLFDSDEIPWYILGVHQIESETN